MIDEGETAPEFSLPAVVDGEVGEVALSDYLGDDIVILAFYPADFNPACSGETTGLDELDLFTMQKDVSIVGISADSVYSHRAFADDYDLHIPLLSDVHGEVATDYGVVADAEEGYLVNRAVVVIDPGGEVQYTWQTEELTHLPPVETVREAVEAVGGSSTAEARYRVGHAHYVEGRRAFTKAMQSFEDAEWMMAQGDFTRAHEEFEEAADQFNTAVRFGEDDRAITYFERAEEKAEALWQAAEWLADSASAYASGEGANGEEMRSDAETPLEEARDIHEPPDPDDFPPEEDPDDLADEESVLPTEEDGPPAALESDIGPKTPEAEELAAEMDSGSPVDEPPGDTPAEETTAEETSASDDTEDGEEEIDDEELEEIAAELEAQTKQAQAEQEVDTASTPEGVVPDATAIADESGDPDLGETTETRDESATGSPDASSGETTGPEDAVGAGETDAADAVDGGEEPASPGSHSDEGASDEETGDPDTEDGEEDIELDLADPTEGKDIEPDEAAEFDDEDDETGDEDLGSGDHGVPDSL